MFQGKWYDEIALGERFGTGVTVTEAHLVLGSGMFGDFNPLHVNEEFSKASMFGTRILHGPFTSALVAAMSRCTRCEPSTRKAAPSRPATSTSASP